MAQPIRPQSPRGVLAEDGFGNATIVVGTGVPADGAGGYAKGCLFIDTDAAAGSRLFSNVGTTTSADFDALMPINLSTLTATAAELNTLDGITATLAELNKLDDSASGSIMTAGAGIAGITAYNSGVFRNGDLIVTRLFVDLADLVVDDADLDIIGDDDAASCNFGQITAARNGTIVGGLLRCLEVPAGAGTVADIDLYSATEGTGTEGVASGVGSLTETALVTAGESWTAGMVKPLTGLPAADEYLYFVAGAAGGDDSAFTAGQFLLELYGTP